MSLKYYLEVLGLIEGATPTEIKAAFKMEIKRWHPDKFSDTSADYLVATEKSKLIIEAYERLKVYKFDIPKQPIKPNTANDITRVTVTSSNIYSIGYDSGKKILQIQFKTGGIYEYSGVPLDLYKALMNAPSKGKFANKYIYFSYPSVSYN